MKKLLVATMALAMLAGSAATALAAHEAVATGNPADKCASYAHGLNLQQSATALSDTSIRVAWNDWCSNEDRYHILRSTISGGVFTTLTTVSAVNGATGVELSYEDSGDPCTTYYYKVKAEKDANRQGNGGGVSETAEFSATTTGCDEGRAAPAIANQYLRSAGGAATAAACEAKYEGSNNWHGEVISAVAQSELQGQTFTSEDEHIVTEWVDDQCAS